MTSPSSSSSPLVGFGTCDWWSRRGSVVIARVPIHQWTGALYSASHLRRGQFLHFQTRLERGTIFGGEIAFFCTFTTFCKRPRVSLRSVRVWLGPRFRSEKEAPALGLNISAGSLRSLFNHLIGWVPLLHQKHGRKRLQNRWKRGSRGGKTRRSCSRGCKGQRTGNLSLWSRTFRGFSSRFLQCVASMACSVFPLASPPRSPGIQGKWPHVTVFTGESLFRFFSVFHV